MTQYEAYRDMDLSLLHVKRIVTSKNKDVVMRFARRTKRTVLWKDENNVWHAATDLNSTPFHCTEKELIS